MTKIYFVRHQAAGVVHERPFLQTPSDEQVNAVARLCFQRFGAVHPKTGEAYWVRVVDVDALGPSDIPDVPDTTLSVVNAAGLGEFSVSGTARVEDKQ